MKITKQTEDLIIIEADKVQLHVSKLEHGAVIIQAWRDDDAPVNLIPNDDNEVEVDG